MSIIEAVGVLTGISAVYLMYKNNALTWPLGFVNIGCFMWMFWEERLYGDFAVQILFLLSGIGGWMNWVNKKRKIPEYLSRTNRVTCLIVTLLITPLSAIFLMRYTTCTFPMAESAILSLSIMGQGLTILRKIENWYYWIATDIVMIGVYAKKDLYLTSIYALIIFIIGIFGVLKWKKLEQTRNTL